MRAAQLFIALVTIQTACAGTIDASPSPAAPDSVPPLRAPGPPAPAAALPPGSGVAPSKSAPVIGPGCGFPPTRIYRLTPVQVKRSLASLLGAAAPGDDLQQTLDGSLPDAKPFSNNDLVLAGSPVLVETLFNGLERSVGAALNAKAALHPCLAMGVTRACVSAVITDFGGRAWRRPLASEELLSYLTFFDGIAAKSDPQRGLEYVLRRLLSAPDFLFRFEWGAAADSRGNVNLTADELAQAMSYVLTDRPPDAVLKAVADRRGLDSRETIATQARRLLETSDLASGVFGFFADLFDGKQTGHSDQPEELRRLVGHVLWNDGAKLSTLLGADYVFVNPGLQKFYGWTKIPAVKDWERITPPSVESRAGILGSGLFLSRNTNRSARGQFIRNLLLCTEVPDPPANINANLDTAKTAASGQLGRPATDDEARAAHMTDPACASCHRLIDPIGKPFSAFDQRGVWQPLNPETKRSYDTGSEIAEAGQIDGVVKDARGLIRSLGAARAVGDCVARHVYEYALGRTPGPDDQCHVLDLSAKFAESGGDLRQLFVDVVGSDAFRVRSNRKRDAL